MDRSLLIGSVVSVVLLLVAITGVRRYKYLQFLKIQVQNVNQVLLHRHLSFRLLILMLLIDCFHQQVQSARQEMFRSAEAASISSCYRKSQDSSIAQEKKKLKVEEAFLVRNQKFTNNRLGYYTELLKRWYLK